MVALLAGEAFLGLRPLHSYLFVVASVGADLLEPLQLPAEVGGEGLDVLEGGLQHGLQNLLALVLDFEEDLAIALVDLVVLALVELLQPVFDSLHLLGAAVPDFIVVVGLHVDSEHVLGVLGGLKCT